MNNHKGGILMYLCLFVSGVMFLPVVASCGKDGTNISTANAQLNIVNVSPDINPFNLLANYIRLSAANYTYPNASGYFLLNTADSPFLLRPALANNVIDVNLLTLNSPLRPNVRYTWFVTGLRADQSLTTVFVADTGSLPAIGRGKIRFVNVSPNSAGLNLTANDTVAFSGIAYKGVTKYREVTAGNYNLNISVSSAPAVAIAGLKSFTVLDGKLYTIYAYGLVGRADTAAFRAGAILNTIPDKFN